MFDLSIYNDKYTFPKLWDKFYKSINHDNVFLNYYEGISLQKVTYKELNAKAHCFAAFLAKNGIKKNDKIVLISQNNPNFYVVELACNLLGIKSLTLPYLNDEKKIQETLHSFKPKLCYIDGYSIYQKIQQEIQNLCKITLLNEKNFEKIAENQTVVLIETAIEIGKVFWRENQDLMNELKNSVHENDILLCITPENSITNKEFILNLKKIINNFNIQSKNKETRLLINSLPFHLLAKYSFYLGIFRHFIIYIGENEILSQSFIKKHKINHLVSSGKLLNQLSYEWLNQKKWSKNFAIQKQKKKLEYKIQNKNLPFGLKIQSKIFSFQRSLLKLQWGSLNTIHTSENEINLEHVLNWNAINIPILTYQIDFKGNIVGQNLVNLNKDIQIPILNQNYKFYSENFFME